MSDLLLMWATIHRRPKFNFSVTAVWNDDLILSHVLYENTFGVACIFEGGSVNV